MYITLLFVFYLKVFVIIKSFFMPENLCVDRRGCSTAQMASFPLSYTIQCTDLLPIGLMITPCFPYQDNKFVITDVRLGGVDS